jgi:eukaryotic-like serine/threonine-protein kinase
MRITEVEDSRGDDLLARLSLPLAQLYRRARNAKSAIDRHHNAYYLAEAALKLAACTRIGAAFAAGLDPRAPLARSLGDLALPSVGHWVGFLREASLHLRDRPDSALLPLAAAGEKLLRPEARPAVKAFADRAGSSGAGESPAIAPDLARDGARQGIIGFFALVAAYRNQVFGHGAQRLPAFYEELGPLLLAAAAEVLREECLFGGLTLAVARLRPDPTGGSTGIEWQGLEGLGGLTLAESRVGAEPAAGPRAIPGQVYFVAPGMRVPLHPLVVYQEDRSERERVGFLNRAVMKRRGGGGEGIAEEVRRVEYLDYATGDILPETDAREAMAAVLSRLRGAAVMALDAGEEAGAEEPAIPSGAGEVIGDFELEGELGRGGMGVVYRARQRSLNRRVALKVLPPALAGDPVSLARFRREIAALARADHPNLVKILTSGSDGDRHYFAMELVAGTSLADLQEVLGSWRTRAARPLRESDLSPAITSTGELAAKRRALSSGRAGAAADEGLPEIERLEPGPPPAVGEGRALRDRLAALFADAAGALAHLHARGILHRDMKPGNLMLTADGARIVVMDLGLAQVRDRSQSLTRTGTRWVGTLRYSAPEQLQWNLLDVDERADVYGLGASLYELVTLAPLFDGDTEPRLIEQVLHQEPRLPRKVDPTVPRDLEAVVMGCLEKDRSRRYANARDLAEDLQRFSDGSPVRVRPVTAPRRLLRWCRRNPALSAASGLVLVALVLVAVISVLFAFERDRNALDLQYRLAESDLIRGEQLAEAGEVERGLHWMARAFEEAPPAAGPLRETIRSNLAGWRNQWLSPRIVIQTGATMIDSAISPDDRQLVTSDIKEVNTWSMENEERIGAPLSVQSAAISFSPDGHFLLVMGGEQAKLWSLVPGARRDKPLREWVTVGFAGFDKQGKRIVTCHADHTVRIWDVETGEPFGRSVPHPSEIRSIEFTNDGTRLLSLCNDGAVKVWWAQTGEEIVTLPGQQKRVNSVAFSPDGKLFVAGGDDRTARLWSAETGKPVGVAIVHQVAVHLVAYSPDGKQVLTCGGKTTQLWSADTCSPIFPPWEHTGGVRAIAFSPDGRLVVTGGDDRAARLWSVETGEPVSGPMTHQYAIYHASFSRSGKWLVTQSQEAIKLWPMPPRNTNGPRFQKPASDYELAFSPDGKRLIGGSAEGTARIWSMENGAAVGAPLAHGARIWTAAFSPDGKRVITGGYNKAVRFWSTETGEPLPLVLLHPSDVREVAFSRDGTKIATACFDYAARIWSATTGEQSCQPMLHENFVEDVAFSPDGKVLLTGSGDQTARLWSVETGQPMGNPLVHPASVLGVAYHPGGLRVATASRDGMARIWSVTTGRQEGLSLEHRGWVEDIEFSPDGSLLVTGCADGAARVWSVETHRLLFPAMRLKEGSVLSVAFSPDGKSIGMAGGNSVQLWDLPSPIEGDAARIRLWTEAATGLEMDQHGTFRYLEPAARREREARLAAQGIEAR